MARAARVSSAAVYGPQQDRSRLHCPCTAATCAALGRPSCPMGCFGPPIAGLLFAPGLGDCLVVSPTGGTASPRHGRRGEMAPHQPEQRQAAEAAKFLINIIKAHILLPVGVLPASIHQGNELCEELLPL